LNSIRAIAFYLPQYHPIPENDLWWGKGFTEWSNVAKAKPLFLNHYQPHIPADLGFYDLRLPEAREAQAALAREYGIHGFCYYHYWFNGRRILERPFNEVLASGKPDFPFCLCWANENWTRAWDGGEREVLLEQKYSHENDIAHIRSLIPAFRDQRYIRIDGKPLFMVYRTELLPEPARTAEIWREEARLAGIGEIYLARVESFASNIDPLQIGFDATVEFAPDWRLLDQCLFRSNIYKQAAKWGILSTTYQEQSITRYDYMVQKMLAKPTPNWTRFRCVTPGFDNSARRNNRGAAIYVDSTPELYGQWLKTLVDQTRELHADTNQIIFINAWNEWAEGNHLEPDQRHGLAYLQMTRNALESKSVQTSSIHTSSSTINTKYPKNNYGLDRLRQYYWSLVNHMNNIKEFIKHAVYWQVKKQLGN
jgi:lipopolysaccharide biosynthesis protein